MLNQNINQMKYTFFIIFTMLCFSQCVDTATEKTTAVKSSKTEKAMDTGTHFKRTTLLVKDIDKSLTIYRDILGFTVYSITESDADSYSYPVFRIPKEAKIRFATLNSPDQIRTMALSEVKGIELPKQQQPIMNASVIRIKDIEGTMKKIIDLGLEHTELKVDESESAGLFKEQSFIDFDGHLIVVYELIP